MVLTRAIDLPAPRGVTGGLLWAARPLEGAWRDGVAFNSAQCLGPGRQGPCGAVEPTSPGDLTGKELEAMSPVAEFASTVIFQGIQCSALSGRDMETLASQHLTVTDEYALGAELLTGETTENPNLEDATILTTGASPVEALVCLENQLAGLLFGRLGVIHLNPALLPLLSDQLIQDGAGYRTMSGHLVAASPGYADSVSMYATGEVYANVGEFRTGSSLQRADNTDEAWAERVGIAVFDPCFLYGVTTDAVLCPTP